MTERCVSHQFDHAKAHCNQCHHPFCEACLVWPFGEEREPMCIACALSAAGIRRGAQRKPVGRAERRLREHPGPRRMRRRRHGALVEDQDSSDVAAELASLPTLGDVMAGTSSRKSTSAGAAASSYTGAGEATTAAIPAAPDDDAGSGSDLRTVSDLPPEIPPLLTRSEAPPPPLLADAWTEELPQPAGIGAAAAEGPAAAVDIPSLPATLGEPEPFPEVATSLPTEQPAAAPAAPPSPPSPAPLAPALAASSLFAAAAPATAPADHHAAPALFDDRRHSPEAPPPEAPTAPERPAAPVAATPVPETTLDGVAPPVPLPPLDFAPPRKFHQPEAPPERESTGPAMVIAPWPN